MIPTAASQSAARAKLWSSQPEARPVRGVACSSKGCALMWQEPIHGVRLFFSASARLKPPIKAGRMSREDGERTIVEIRHAMNGERNEQRITLEDYKRIEAELRKWSLKASSRKKTWRPA